MGANALPAHGFSDAWCRGFTIDRRNLGCRSNSSGPTRRTKPLADFGISRVGMFGGWCGSGWSGGRDSQSPSSCLGIVVARSAHDLGSCDRGFRPICGIDESHQSSFVQHIPLWNISILVSVAFMAIPRQTVPLDEG